jgi:hypothetical protein
MNFELARWGNAGGTLTKAANNVESLFHKAELWFHFNIVF